MERERERGGRVNMGVEKEVGGKRTRKAEGKIGGQITNVRGGWSVDTAAKGHTGRLSRLFFSFYYLFLLVIIGLG